MLKAELIFLLLLLRTAAVLPQDEDPDIYAEEDHDNSLKDYYHNNSSGSCFDELADDKCEQVLNAECPKENEMTSQCRRSCKLCTSSRSEKEWSSNEERASKCKDMLPFCDVFNNPCICCILKPMTNASCQRTCRFCYDMQSIPGVSNVPISSVPGMGMGSSSVLEPPVVYQDPCNPTSAPGVSGGPQVPGGTPGGGSQAQGIPGGSNIPSGSNIPGGSNMPGGSNIPGAPTQVGGNNGLPLACTAGAAGLPGG